MVVKCKDCDEEIVIYSDAEEGDIISCPCCGIEYKIVFDNGVPNLVELELEGEDWGE
jgi:alpha-aminoadipate/glutamate carrier protein LysW